MVETRRLLFLLSTVYCLLSTSLCLRLFTLLLIHLPQRVEDEVGVGGRLDADGEFVPAPGEVEAAGGDFDEEAEGEGAARRVALGVHDAAVVEEDPAAARGAFDGERPRQARVLQDLHGVEDADGRQVAGEGDGARGRRGRRGLRRGGRVLEVG